MLIKTRAIVLHHIKYGETSIIATLYTEKYGRLSSMVSGARTKKTKFPMTYFQPLTLLETEIYYKPNRELHRLKDLACPFHYVSIPFVIAKNAIALFLAEILYHTLREQEGNPRLFGFLFHVFQLLDTQEEGILNFHVRFLLHYAGYLGFSLENLGALSGTSDHREFHNLPYEAAKAAIEMMNTPIAQPARFIISDANRQILLDSLLNYYAEHVDGMGRLKSLPILKEIFRD